MKRTLKKLTLSRETLRLLTHRQMEAALGGNGSGDTCPICLLTPRCPTELSCVSNCSQAQACCA